MSNDAVELCPVGWHSYGVRGGEIMEWQDTRPATSDRAAPAAVLRSLPSSILNIHVLESSTLAGMGHILLGFESIVTLALYTFVLLCPVHVLESSTLAGMGHILLGFESIVTLALSTFVLLCPVHVLESSTLAVHVLESSTLAAMDHILLGFQSIVTLSLSIYLCIMCPVHVLESSTLAVEIHHCTCTCDDPAAVGYCDTLITEVAALTLPGLIWATLSVWMMKKSSSRDDGFTSSPCFTVMVEKSRENAAKA
ncbi:hypothetical protein J6590_044189 [Homalodisca vitripennis]|nr:hypothetical protein J6590_044189 [Homalodisca vitripennis]